MNCLIIAAGAGLALASAPGRPAVPTTVASVDVRPFDARQISPQVHMLGTPQDYHGPAIGNVSIIEQSDGFVVVDSGLTAGNGRTIVNSIRTRSGKPVKAVVITHWHNDHPQGISAIREAWPNVRIIATPQTKAGMLGGELGPLVGLQPSDKNYTEMAKLVSETKSRFDKQLSDPATSPERRQVLEKAKQDFDRFLPSYRGTYVVPPTETFTDELTIDDPQTPVRVMFLGRANTAGDAVVWLPTQKIVITGDIVVAPTPFGFFSFPSEWVQTLAKIKALGYATLIPGHGEPQTDTRYIDQLVGSIEDIRSQVSALAKQGLSLEEVNERVDFTRYAAIFGTTEQRKRLFKAYWTDPMTENAWKEARGLPIVQGEGEVTVSTQAPKTRN